MEVMINGVAAQIDEDMTVAELVASRVDASRHVAVALNATVVSRAEWVATRLHPGDTVEVLAPVAGG